MMNSPGLVAWVPTGTASSAVAKTAEGVETRGMEIEIEAEPAGITAEPAEEPRTLREPVTARSPLTVIVPVRDEMLDARSSKVSRPTWSCPVTVVSDSRVGPVTERVVNEPESTEGPEVRERLVKGETRTGMVGVGLAGSQGPRARPMAG